MFSSSSNSSPRIGIYGNDLFVTDGESRGCYLWPAGYAASLTAAGATPTFLELPKPGQSWDHLLADVEGVLFLGYETTNAKQAAEEERLCQWCRKKSLPFLGIDQGLHILNTTFGGNLYLDLAKELPQALQHRHPPEKGLRHAIMVEPGTRMAEMYGEGEIVVNSEHRRGVNQVAKGFRVGAKALDGVIEAIEAESERWFAVGAQWQPASASASGLDIQIFRGLIDACQNRRQQVVGLAA